MTIREEEWRDRALCAGMATREHDPFFPVGVGGSIALAREVKAAVRVCRRCPVRLECAEAGADETEGVWAGVYKGANSRGPRVLSRCVYPGSSAGLDRHERIDEDDCPACDEFRARQWRYSRRSTA